MAEMWTTWELGAAKRKIALYEETVKEIREIAQKAVDAPFQDYGDSVSERVILEELDELEEKLKYVR
jgi:hypothetical protein